MKNKQRGFSAIEAIIILLILLLLLLLGWWIWQQNQKKDDSANKDNSNSQQSQNNDQNGQDGEQKTYLVINEWGVRFKTSANNADAYYAIEPGKPDYAYVSLNSLKNVDDCAADKTSVGAYTRFTKDDIDPIAEQKYIDLYPGAPKVGDYYFIFSQPQAYCSENQATIATAESATAAFKDSTATVEANP